MNKQQHKQAFKRGFNLGVNGIEFKRNRSMSKAFNETYKDGYDYGSLIDESCPQEPYSYFIEWWENRESK